MLACENGGRREWVPEPCSCSSKVHAGVADGGGGGCIGGVKKKERAKGRARATSLREICKERRRDEAVCEQGICQTAIKKVCRRLGIMKWPYKEMRTPPERAQDKGDYKGEAADNSDAARYCAVRYL